MVLSWLSSLNPAELQATIAQNGSLVAFVRQSFPFIPMSFVRAILTADERAQLTQIGPQGFEALLDIILQQAPEIGEILWANREWYLREIAALRDAVAGE